MMDMFRDNIDSPGGRATDQSSMEIRATALVLSGCLPPLIILDESYDDAKRVVEGSAGLLPQKALMTG